MLSITIREVQKKTTVRYYSYQSKWPSSKKYTNNKCWRRVERGTFLHCWWECKLIYSLWRTVWRFLKKLRRELACDPAVQLLGTYLEKTRIPKNTYILMFIAALVTKARICKQPRYPSTKEWIKKMWGVCVCVYTYVHVYVCTHTCTMEYYSIIKRKTIMPFAETCINLETKLNHKL